MILVVEVERQSNAWYGPLSVWIEIARWEADPFGTPYNEAIFCPQCGRVWSRRRWLNADCSWWIDLRKCDESPFTPYDFEYAHQSRNPELMEYLVEHFLDNLAADI